MAQNIKLVVPNDLVTDILERLPTKSLGRFMFVSKEWYDVIKNPTFINNHHNKHGKKHNMLMVMRRSRNLAVLSLHDLDSPEQDEVRPNILERLKFDRHGRFSFLGGLWSDGIVCIIQNSRIALWNPAATELKLVPPFPRDNVHGYFETVLFEGFGVTCTGEIKVILVCTYVNGRRNFSSAARPDSFPVHLYSSTTNSWKRIGFEYSCLPRHSGDKQLFFNGASHWLATPICSDTRLPFILSFNLASEVLTELELPEGYGSLSTAQLAVVNDCLAIGRYDKYGRGKLVILVMKEYGIRESWTRQIITMPQASPDINKILYWENELLFTETFSTAIDRFGGPSQLASYSFLTGKFTKYQVTVDENTEQALIYQDSLLRLN